MPQTYCSFPNLRWRVTSSLPGTSSICHDTSHTHDHIETKHFKSQHIPEKKHTVQIPAFLNSLREFGSSSIAASFSYANSSAIFALTEPSAVNAQTQLHQ